MARGCCSGLLVKWARLHSRGIGFAPGQPPPHAHQQPQPQHEHPRLRPVHLRPQRFVGFVVGLLRNSREKRAAAHRDAAAIWVGVDDRLQRVDEHDAQRLRRDIEQPSGLVLRDWV